MEVVAIDFGAGVGGLLWMLALGWGLALAGGMAVNLIVEWMWRRWGHRG